MGLRRPSGPAIGQKSPLLIRSMICPSKRNVEEVISPNDDPRNVATKQPAGNTRELARAHQVAFARKPGASADEAPLEVVAVCLERYPFHPKAHRDDYPGKG
jgi:hypothetical protein